MAMRKAKPLVSRVMEAQCELQACACERTRCRFHSRATRQCAGKLRELGTAQEQLQADGSGQSNAANCVQKGSADTRELVLTPAALPTFLELHNGQRELLQPLRLESIKGDEACRSLWSGCK